MTRPGKWLAAASWGALLAAGCSAAPPPAAPPREYPGVLHAPSSYPGNFLDEQKVTATFGTHTTTFDAVVQKQGDVLTVLGRTPFGSRAFALVQKGDAVTFEKYVDRELPFPPRYMLLDVHRTLLVGLAPAGAALPDGLYAATRDDERIAERWEGGRLRERRFSRVSGQPSGDLVVTYEGGLGADGVPPRRLTFDNGWFGYRLEIVTTSHQAL